jgi:cell division protein FtsZ
MEAEHQISCLSQLQKLQVVVPAELNITMKQVERTVINPVDGRYSATEMTIEESLNESR